MSLPRKKGRNFLTQKICRAHPNLKLIIVDVGARGGIEKIWDIFGDQKEAVGFDPVVEECEKANQGKPKNTSYLPLWITCEEQHQLEVAVKKGLVKLASNQSYKRSSCVEYRRICGDPRPQPTMKTLSEKRESLDAWINQSGFPPPDYLKIDTDGHDLQVLYGAEETIKKSVLSIKVECQFHGYSHPLANTFANIDIFLRAIGFSLLDLDCHHYSRASLPGMFTNSVCAQTITGPIMWADALYGRDLCLPDYETTFDFAITQEKVLKMACIYECFNLEDCATEILLKYKNYWDANTMHDLLNCLTPELFGKKSSYDEFIAFFNKNPKQFVPAPKNKT